MSVVGFNMFSNTASGIIDDLKMCLHCDFEKVKLTKQEIQLNENRIRLTLDEVNEDSYTFDVKGNFHRIISYTGEVLKLNEDIHIYGWITTTASTNSELEWTSNGEINTTLNKNTLHFESNDFRNVITRIDKNSGDKLCNSLDIVFNQRIDTLAFEGSDTTILTLTYKDGTTSTLKIIIYKGVNVYRLGDYSLKEEVNLDSNILIFNVGEEQITLTQTSSKGVNMSSYAPTSDGLAMYLDKNLNELPYESSITFDNGLKLYLVNVNGLTPHCSFFGKEGTIQEGFITFDFNELRQQAVLLTWIVMDLSQVF